MRLPIIALLIPALLPPVLACGTAESRAQDSLAELREKIATKQIEQAFQDSFALHAKHPGTAADRDAFILATALHRHLYFRDRYQNPDAPWVGKRRQDLFAWFETWFSPGEETAFPQDQAEALFVGMNYGLVRDFEAFASARPTLAAWRLVVEKDNGIVESVTGERRAEAVASEADERTDTSPPTS